MIRINREDDGKWLYMETKTSMSASDIAKKIIKKPFNALGMDIVKLDKRQFEPTPATEFLWLSSLDINTVVDVGAHEGEFATMIHGVLPRAMLISFEPLPDVHRELVSNMREVPNFTAFNCALGDANTRTSMHRNEFSDSSSLLEIEDLHKQAFPFTARTTSESIEVKRLDDVVADLSLPNNILIKIDAQGYEDKVIAGGEKLVARAKLIIAEVSFKPLYKGQPLFDDIYELLKQRGFKYAGNLDSGMGSLPQLRNPLDGSVLQANAIFIRHESR